MYPEQSGPLGSSSPSTTSLDSSQNDKVSMIRVLLVDDHTMLRQGLRSVIDGSHRMVVVAEAGNGVEAIEAVHHSKPDVVVMDVNMPRMNGIEATKRIKEEFPEMPIVGCLYKREWTSSSKCKPPVFTPILRKNRQLKRCAAP